MKKRPRDPNQLGKLIIDIATGQVEDRTPTPEEQGKDPAAVALGRKGGLKGGKARAAKLTASQCLSGNFSLKTLDESRHGLPNMLLSGTSFNFAIWKSESNQTHVSGRTLNDQGQPSCLISPPRLQG